MKAFVVSAVVGLSGAAVQAQDWSGIYGVLGVSNVGGDWIEIINGSTNAVRDNEGQLKNLGLGYNLQNGAWVYGAEIAYSNDHVTAATFDPTTTYLEGMLDLKARAGYAAGRTLFYGVLGWSSADRYMNAPQVTNEPIKASGVAYGIGAEMLLSDNVIIGLELVQRQMKIDEGEIGGFPILSYDHEVQTIGLRVGFKF